MNSLDLGCGANPRNPFNADNLFGVDVRDLGTQIKKANLFLDPIPFESNFFDYVTAYDFIEHVPRVITVFELDTQQNVIRYPFITLMNEIHRVLKHGGIFFSRTPAFPSPEAFQDPTHVNFISENTFPLYFNDRYPVAHIYGFTGGFKVLSQDWDGPYLVTKLAKALSPDLGSFQKY
jgi:SAM-dependent methyltransferase